MGPQPRFSWIHLSDIHIGHGDATHIADQKLVLSAICSDIERMLTSGVPQPDAIFVTGDIAFSGACRTSDEYTRAAQWLTVIAKTARLGLDAVFVVPGNHDVQRSADKPVAAAALLRQLRAGGVSIDAALTDPDAHARLKARQANYLAFAESFAPASRTDAEVTSAQLYWRHNLKAHGGLRIRIVGLNTALLAADEAIFDSDQKRLWLGTIQLSAAFTEPAVAPDEVVIVLSHHPLRERWLADENEVAGWIRKHAHLHLSGHVHEADSERTRGGGGTDFVSIVGGAAHGEKTLHGYPARHGYSFGALMADNGALKVRVWPRIWSSSNKDFRLDGDSVKPGAEYAEHDLPRVRLPGNDSVATNTVPPESGSGGVQASATIEPPAISPTQRALLVRLCDVANAVPATERRDFMTASSFSGFSVIAPDGRTNLRGINPADLRELADLSLLRITHWRKHQDFNFHITNRGMAEGMRHGLSHNVTSEGERFCDPLHWPLLKKMGDWVFHAENKYIEGSGIFHFLLSQREYGPRPFIITTRLQFFGYGDFSKDGPDTANAGIVLGWNSSERRTSYYHLLFTGQQILLEEVGAGGGGDYRDFRHLSPPTAFDIKDGHLYQITLHISQNLIDVFVDQRHLCALHPPNRILGKVGMRPWRAKIRCTQFEVREQ